MKLTRRSFLKGGAGAGGGALASFLSGKPKTLVARAEAQAQAAEEWVPTTCWIGKQEGGMVARKIREVRARDKRLLVWQKGRSKSGALYDSAFVNASGATKLHHGAFCSDAGYRAAEYTIGLHGVLHPDFRHTKYLLSRGG